MLSYTCFVDLVFLSFCFFKQKTAYEMRISDWSSDVCSSDLQAEDDSLFGFIARVDEKDRETVFDNEDCWQKALPALGITYPIDNVRKRVTTEIGRASCRERVCQYV